MADGTDLWAVLLSEKKLCYPHVEQPLNVKTALSCDRQTPKSSVRPFPRTSPIPVVHYQEILISFCHLADSFHLTRTKAQSQGQHVHKELFASDAGPSGCQPSAGPVGLCNSAEPSTQI